jgi:hypothetical protein
MALLIISIIVGCGGGGGGGGGRGLIKCFIYHLAHVVDFLTRVGRLFQFWPFFSV